MQNHMLLIKNHKKKKHSLNLTVFQHVAVLLHLVTFITGGAAVGVSKCKHTLGAHWVAETTAVTLP